MHKVGLMAPKTRLLPSHPPVMGYYERSVLEMVSLIHGLEADPWTAGDKCLCVQMKLLEKTRHVENKIRATKANIKRTRDVLGKQTSPVLGKIRARDAKKALLTFHSKLDGYRRVLHILKDIGDALAFMYIDKYDIKPMRFKEASGFISGKTGLRKELLQLRRVFKLGGIGILNDLTHCLRYGDITVGYRGRMLATVEVKSGRKRDQRGMRQSIGIAKIANYLRTDQTHDLYGIDGEFHRFAVKGVEVNHRNRLDVLIRQARKYGLSWEEVENGQFYVVVYENNLGWMNSINQRCKGKPMWTIINELKWQNLAYYPFTLSFHDPTALWEFYIGKMLVISVIDTKVLEEHFIAQRLRGELLEEEDFALRVLDLGGQADGPLAAEHKVSRQFFHRLSAEFLGLEWMCYQICSLRLAATEASRRAATSRTSQIARPEESNNLGV